MASERQNMSDQEISIKARENELYTSAPVEVSRQVKPFPVYLRETPAEPLSPATKAILWIVGIVVTLLFLAALWRVSRGHLARPPARTARPVSTAATVDVSRSGTSRLLWARDGSNFPVIYGINHETE